MKLIGWLLATHRRHKLLPRAYESAPGSPCKVPSDHEGPAKAKTFVQLSPCMEVRVRSRVKRERGYDYPELHEQDSTARLRLARSILERQLQVH
jgi:hypothetical protein